MTRTFTLFAFVLRNKFCEAMAVELKGRTLGGEGKTTDMNGRYFGSFVKPANKKRATGIGASPRTRMASANASSSSVSVTATATQPCSAQKAQR